MTNKSSSGLFRTVKFDGEWHTEPDYKIDLVACPKRIRVEFGGEVIADSLAVITLCEQAHIPAYYIPMSDVRMDLMTPTEHSTHCPHKGDASYWTLSVGDRSEENVIWGYQTPFPHMSKLAGHVAFYWNKMDKWLEEDEEVFVHARDPYKRIDILTSSRPVKVVLGGEAVAESTNALFLAETGLPVRYYIPASDVRMDLLTAIETKTACPYKGTASYWRADVGGQSWDDIVWSYSDPVDESTRIKDHFCFYNEVVDAIYVDGVELPRPLTKWSR